MKRNLMRWMLLLAALAVLLMPQAARAQGGDSDKFVLGGSYTLPAGETLAGNLIVVGGFAQLEPGSRLGGDAFLMGGTLSSAGEIAGDILAAGGLVQLQSGAHVNGDINLAGAHLERQAGVTVAGEINQANEDSLPLVLPGGMQAPEVQSAFDPIFGALWVLLRSFLWAALAVVVVLFAPRQIELAGRAASGQPLTAAGLGLLTIVAVPLVLLVMAITLILIPVSLLGFFLLGLAWALGILVAGAEVGRRLELSLRQDWAPPVSAAIGVFGLTLLVNTLNAVIPCVGWLAPTLAGILGLGGLLLTRLGSQPYSPHAAEHNETLPPAAAVPPPPELPPPGDEV